MRVGHRSGACRYPGGQELSTGLEVSESAELQDGVGLR